MPETIAVADMRAILVLNLRGTRELDILSTSDTLKVIMPRQLMHYDRMQRLVAHALENGGQRVSAVWFQWNTEGKCTMPVHRDLYSRPPKGRGEKWITVAPGKRAPLGLRLQTKCRKCDQCLKARAAFWRLRAQQEFIGAERTWFITLTFKPEEQFRLLEAARHNVAQGGGDFEMLPPKEQFARLVTQSGREVTKFLKRVRKNSGSRFKYLSVAEEHKSGKPHWHLLVFENDPFKPVRHSVLSAAWVLGFTQIKLAEEKHGAYLCKYLSKSLSARVRASQGFGQ